MAKKTFMSASPFRVTVNQKQLLKELHVENARVMSQKLRRFIEPKLEKKQEHLVKKFKVHPITIEIDGGPTASNSSGTLGGYGNLFSFIGFGSGDEPTDIIKKIFSEKIRFKVKRKGSSGKYTIVFFIPSLEEIYALTPLPWATGQSWVDGVEKGMSNVGSYLYSATGFSSSRSRTGIQAESKTSGVSFKNTPYVAKLIENFKKTLKNL
mgnify:CR=1 FL=1|tara:strand:- start:2216 stop:2842 length:627 start_codon:yes stop_codon:yes gene_type:complete